MTDQQRPDHDKARDAGDPEHIRPMDDPTRGRQGDKLENELPHGKAKDPGGSPAGPRKD